MTDSTAPQMKRALAALEKMQARLERTVEPIAVIGMGCRFPGAANPDEFWRLLVEGRDAVSEAPAGRGEGMGRGGYLCGIEEFDHEFFHVAAKEAVMMDPQQRVLLEVAWEALEDACIPAESLFGGNVGVYVGACSFDFALWRARRGLRAGAEGYFATGAALSVASGRLSYFLGLNGPAMTVDTACSSSLVAVHQACAALRADECEMAIAGGVSVLMEPEYSEKFRTAGMLAGDGKCKTFDAAADGFARAEGCGLLVLKRLSDAERDGDRVRAVIRGSAVNQDGASGGLTVPSGPAQEDVVRRALKAARVGAAEIDYVEAHGTGTALGDPIEVEALNEVFAGRDRALAVGSVKTNLGHAEAAAGVAGLMKTILAMENGVLPAHLHFSRANPYLDLRRVPVEIPVAAREWPGKAGEPRRAGVSAFGLSGTNAHVVVEGQRDRGTEGQGTRDGDAGEIPFVISAATETALRELAGRWADWLRAHPEFSLQEICAAAMWGRARLEQRIVLKAPGVEELAEALEAIARGGKIPVAELPVIEPQWSWRRLAMPLYPFQRVRHWLEDSEAGAAREAVRAEGDLREWLTAELAAILGEGDASRIDARRGFAELGMDSMMAAQLAEAIGREWGIELPVMTVFNYPTLEELAAQVETELNAGLGTKLGTTRTGGTYAAR